MLFQPVLEGAWRDEERMCAAHRGSGECSEKASQETNASEGRSLEFETPWHPLPVKCRAERNIMDATELGT